MSRRRTKKSLQSVEAVAFHEAGHVIAHHALKIGTRSVTVVPDGEAEGCMRAYDRGTFILDDTPTSRERQRVQREIIALYAGWAAVSQWFGRELTVAEAGAGRDDETAKRLAVSISGWPPEHRYLQQWLMARSWNLVREQWACVQAVATVLSEHKTVYGRRLRQIIAAAEERQVADNAEVG
jgi:hypothetical protein